MVMNQHSGPPGEKVQRAVKSTSDCHCSISCLHKDTDRVSLDCLKHVMCLESLILEVGPGSTSREIGQR